MALSGRRARHREWDRPRHRARPRRGWGRRRREHRREEEAALATVAEIEKLGRRARAYAASVADADACARMVGDAVADLGHLDILFNDAGIASRGQSVATLHHTALGAPYHMAKAAMESLAFTLAKEVKKHGIRVNGVAPGLVETEMGRRLMKATAGVDDLRQLDAAIAFSRICQPEDVANAVR